MRGATNLTAASMIRSGFQSTLPMRGATIIFFLCHRSNSISIHTPHAGSDSCKLSMQVIISLFQSTLPMRGATLLFLVILLWMINFNPHSPCGERLLPAIPLVFWLDISIHTPHAGSDSKSYRIHIKFKNKIYDIRNKNKL